MRHVLTGIALLLVVVILAAMAVPHFVDFGQYRGFFEKRIAALTGHPATISGTIKLRLLPTPSLSMRQVQLGPKDEKGFALFEAERIAGSLSAMPLLRGDFHITEALIDRPILRVGATGIESLTGTRLPQGGETGGTVSIERLTIGDGTAVFQRNGREPLTISEYNGEIEASTLQGPARGNGHFILDGRKRHIRFSLGKIEQQKARIKALLEDEGLAVRLDVDGVAALGADSAERFDGTISMVSNTALGTQERVQLPLRVNAKAKLSGTVLSLADLNVVVGQEPQPLALTGEGKVILGTRPRYDVTLAARSYDFDRPGPDGRPRRVAPADLIREAAALFPGGAGAPDIEGRFDISAGALIIGGQTVVGPHAIVDQHPGGIRVVKAEGELPGQTRILFERDDLSDDGILSGLLQIDSRDPEKLNGWFNGVARTTTSAAATSASVILSSIKDGVQIDRIEIDRGETHLSGTGRYLLPTPGARPAPQLGLKLSSGRLHIGDIPSFVPGAARKDDKPDLDFDIDLVADRLSLDGRDIGSLITKARRDGAITSIERIEIAGLDRSSFIASGTLGGGSRRLTVKLDAEKAGSIAAIAAQVFPGPMTEGLLRRADAFSPALIVATLANNETEDSYDLSAEGQLGGSNVGVTGKLIAKADILFDVVLRTENPDSGRLARQIFGTQGRLAARQPGSGKFSIKGNPRATMEVVAEASIFGLNLDVRGGVNLFQPFVPFNGILAARTGDLAPTMTALGLQGRYVPAGAKGALTGKLESNLQKITITDLRAQLGDLPLTGEVAFKIGEGGTVAGQLRTPLLDMRPLLAIALGPTPQLLPPKGWSTTAFAAPVPPPLKGDLWLEADQAQLDDTIKLDGARFVFRFADGLAAVEHSEFKLGPARFTGDASLRRNGATVAATTRFAFTDLNIEKVFGVPLKGVAAGDMQATGAGDTPAKLAQSLAGSGQALVAGLSIAGHDPAALSRLIAIPPQDIGAVDAANLTRRLDVELRKAPLVAENVRFPLVLIDGNLRIGTAALDTGGTRNEVSGVYDLTRLAGDFRVQTAMTGTPEAWKGAQPFFTAQWRGPLSGLQRSLSVEQIVNGYLAAALQRDAELREIQEQDLRERAYFNRRLKAMEWEKRRAEEARQEALRTEQAKQADEERLRRQKTAEEATRREAERQQRLAAEEAQRQRQIRDPADKTAPAPAAAPPSASVPPPSAGQPLDLRPPTQ